MKISFHTLLIFAVVLLTGCNKEKPVEPPPPTKVESPIFKSQITTLHKTEEVKELNTEAITDQKNQIDAATQ